VYFTGRDEALERLHHELRVGTKVRTRVLSGLGGAGKSQLALEYAFRYSADYDGIWWLRAEDNSTLTGDYVALAPHLGLPSASPPGGSQQELVAQVRRALSERARFLLVFDNAVEPRRLESFLPQGTECHVLITTRASTWPGAALMSVAGLTTDEAVEFLHVRSGQSRADGSAEDIASLLGGLPLALEQAAAYAHSRGTTLDRYARLLRTNGLQILEREQPYNYERTVGTTWLIALAALKSTPAAEAFLSLVSFMAPEEIHLGDLRDAAALVCQRNDSGNLPATLATALTDELALEDAKGELLKHSLVHVEGDVVTVHRLIQAVTREHLSAEDRQRYSLSVVELMSALLPVDSDDSRHWQLCSRLVPHVLTRAREGATVSREHVGLLYRTGNYFTGIGNYAAAENTYRQGIVLLAAMPDARLHEPELLNGLALALKRTDRLAEAQALYERAHDLYRSRGAERTIAAAEVLNNLAVVLTERNRPADAEKLYRTALEVPATLEGSDAAAPALEVRILGNLATLLHTNGQLAESEEMHRRSLELAERHFGTQDPRVAIRLSNLARLLASTNRAAESESLLRRALAIDEARLPPTHPNVALRSRYLGSVLANTGRVHEGRQLLERAVAILSRTLGDAHSMTIAAQRDLGSVADRANLEPGDDAEAARPLHEITMGAEPH
jgi:tetratricopeptide (TPR) repeat protein